MARREYGYRRRRYCKFCEEKIEYIDWKDVNLLRSYVPERGKIMARRISGTCATHQRRLTRAIKRARHAALLPYTAE
jgi:small subunit ribosomal protein S18